MLQDYYGNSRGTVLGPYSENEIGSRLRAIEALKGEGVQVYCVRATSYLHAKTKIVSEAARDKGETK